MLDALLGFMIANPATSHALTALPETAGVAAAMIGLRAPRPEATAALVVSTYYFGREAGQREHDIKHAGWDAVQAHLGAEFLYGWSLPNLQQWLAPTCAAWAIAAAMILVRRRSVRGR
ncbi:hypothetical protein [Methylobacterium brachiatum]|jgi:hypothetical protein|uniref:Uncharacterized protein n=1 Tax=Methylobacterium brachiatum TaxID=269660 RepID=A0AAJ1WXB4_9HYPH|nr:hypothetical protein [Methylobacterium brachiatum]MCB4805424.1 hypothetical protein [Methylobacterium brachiatum]MDH2309953.1 hypothetical protein [Methylobacterium brachiatum]MDQ0546449.1 hypothetical protein [Methylobacterium brachiatum]